jgi:hypothetical protein
LESGEDLSSNPITVSGAAGRGQEQYTGVYDVGKTCAEINSNAIRSLFNNMKPLLLILFFCLLPYFCKADQPRFQTTFSSKNGLYELRLLGTRKDSTTKYVDETGSTFYLTVSSWAMFATQTQQKLYSFEDCSDNIALKTALISDNGNRVAVLDDWSAGVPFFNYGVLSFYERGHRIKKYVLHDLLCSCGSISSSVSHFSWLTNYRFAPLTNSLTISTYELNTFVFDLTSGRLLSKRRNSAITNTSVLVAGRVPL